MFARPAGFDHLSSLSPTPLCLLILSLPLCADADQQLVSSNLSFQTQDQSMWSSGEAFIFEYSEFFGLKVNPDPVTFNPSAVSGTGYTVNPYFLFDTDFEVGMEVGASVNGGAIDANLDYGVSITAPDTITMGQPFALTGAVTPQGSSGFQSTPAKASAYVDGILAVYFGGYARFTTSGIWLGTDDYRMGRNGFTDLPASNNNTPYRTLANVNYRPEIIGINRNESGQLHVLGQNQGGTGSEYQLGATTITAGNWNVYATGTLQDGAVKGSGSETLVTASLDIDQMATLGVPALGTGFAHDWGAIEIDVGYDIVDVRSTLKMGLFQDFSIASDVLVNLQFSENVILEGVGETNSYSGPLGEIPNVTLLTTSVTVEPTYLVDARLSNETGLNFVGSVGTTIIEGHVYAEWDAGIFGSGTAADFSMGPFYENDYNILEFEIPVFSNEFDLGGFQAVPGQSFQIVAEVPGDFDIDGDVDGSDFLLWQRNPGVGDLADWQTNFGTTTPPLAAFQAVPEPGACILLLAALAPLVNLRRLRS